MIKKSFVAAVVFAIGLFVLPAVAGAHVEIAPDGSLGADGSQKATLAVPNECVNATTTSVDLNFPATPALTTVEVAPLTGYTYTNTTGANNAVTKLTITGEVAGDGEKDQKEFALTLGSVPAGTDSLKFTALQNCSDGSVIRWVEPTPPGGEEPEHPAPVLTIKKTSGGGTDTTTTTKVADSKSDDSNTGLIVGIVVAVVVIGGGAAYLLTRKKSAGAS